MNDKLNTTSNFRAGMSAGHSLSDTQSPRGVFHLRVLDHAEGNVIHEESFTNLVCYQGLNFRNDMVLSNSSTGVSCYMSLITAGTPSSAMTYASPVVTEATSSLIAARQPVGWTASSNGTKAANTVSFTALSAGTITGGMIVLGNTANSLAVVANTGGVGNILFSAGTFSTAQPVIANNVLQLSYSITS